MSKKHLLRRAYHINKEVWLYEENYGIDIVYEIKKEDGSHLKTEIVKIPLKKIRGYLSRRDNR